MGIFKALKQRKRAGFTMAEVLVVVAVVGILAGVAIPSILAVQKNLQMAEADSAARSVYIAAQNRMSELRISGALSDLGGSPMAVPSDFPGELIWSNGEYLWLSSDDSAARELLFPEGALEAGLLSGTFFVEYNAVAGMVYSVFYSTDSFFYSAALPRESDFRRSHDPILGYYGGSGVDYSGQEFALLPEWEIVNEDELYIKISPDNFTPDTYRLTLRDESGGEEIVEFKNGDIAILPGMVSYDIVNRQYTVLLDSLESEWQFKNLFGGLSAGDNISVTLAVIPSGAELASAETKSVNSLFANRAGERATVSYPRHIQNLHQAFSNVDSGVTSAFQGREIVWSSEDFGQFISIDNPDLKGFDGGNNPLRGFNAALFNSFTATEEDQAEVKNVRLIDPAVSASGANAGMLVNTAVYTRFTNCHVFSEEPESQEGCVLTSSGAQNTGGLVGLATSCNFEKCLSSLTRINASSGAVGGLVGSLVGGTVKECYADTGFWNLTDGAWHSSSGIISYGTVAGGLVGRVSGGRIESSYCVGNIQMKNTGGTASGFAGSSSGSVYLNCYSASTFEGSETDNVFGFFNSATLPSGSCHFLKNSAVETGAENGTGYDDLIKLFTGNSIWAASSASVTEAYGRRGEDSPAYPFPRLSGMRHYGDWPDEEIKLGAGLFYYEKYQNGQYGVHAAIGRNQISTLRDTLVVLEDGYAILVEKGGAKPQYTVGTSSTRYTLADSTVEVQDEEGTYILYPLNLANVTTANATVFYTRLVIVGEESAEAWLNPSFAKAAVNENPGGSAPPRPNTFILRTARHLSRLSALSGSYYWNATTGTNSSRPYVQERDIDFSKYAVTQSYSPIGSTSGSPFRGSYNGGSRIITGLEIRTSNNAGLFGHVVSGARLDNIIFVSDLDGSVVRRIEKTSNNGVVGGLVAVNAGTISNCAVAGFNISGGSGFLGEVYVGGFVGQNTGTITNCSASNGYFDGSGTGGTLTAKRGLLASAAAGGFVGQNSGTITSCYAVGRMVTTQVLLDWAESYGFSGTSGGTITNSYCATIATSNAWWWTTNDYLVFSPGTVHSSNRARSANYTVEDLMNENMGAAWGKALAINTHAYEAGRENENYPFPAIVRRGGAYVHYGNWPQEAVSLSFENSLAYYEKYADDSIGYYIVDDGAVSDSLREDIAVVEDGYVLLSRQTPDSNGNYPSLTIKSSLFSNNSTVSASQTVTGEDFGSGGYAAYYLRPGGSILSFNSNINMERSYAELSATIGGKAVIFYYNPNYAKALGVSESPLPGEVFEIRTARHLARMAASINTYPSSAASAKWVAESYVQTRDIDFQTYATALTLSPIASTGHNNGFAGVYDGGGYVISGVMQLQHGGATGTSGLFGTVDTNGIIRNVKFIAAGTGTPTISGGQSQGKTGTGAFVGRNRGTIENCAVSGFNVTGPILVGGFVGANDGTIRNCSAANAAFVTNDKGGGVATTQHGWGVGGFAALNSGTIEDCYAVSLLYPAVGATAYGFVADNTGTVTNSYCVAVNSAGGFLSFGRTTPEGCYALGVGGVTAETIIQAFTDNRQWGFADSAYSHPYSAGLEGQAYPLPAVVKDPKEEFEHYGNWPPEAMLTALSRMPGEDGEAEGETEESPLPEAAPATEESDTGQAGTAAPPVTEALPPNEPVTGEGGEENPK